MELFVTINVFLYYITRIRNKDFIQLNLWPSLFYIAVSDIGFSPKTSVKWQILEYYLKDHKDRDLVDWCVNGFCNGFTLGLEGEPVPWPDPPNSTKVQENPKVTWELINDEIQKGFIIGPFQEKPIEGLFCVLINIIEKETSSGLYCLVQDFSYPWGDPTNGINALVPGENKKVHYARIDDVARMALQLGNPSYAMRIDIKHAFKLLPLSPDQWHFTGFRFRGAYFIQTQTPFGAAASCLHFEKVARFLTWIIRHKFPWALLCSYLDDFWLTQKRLHDLEELAFHFTQIIEDEMGFPISHNKTLGPDTELNFVGLTTNLVNLSISLPEDKRLKSIKLIDVLLKAHRLNEFVTIKDLEKCTGMLNYACQAIPFGCPWLQSCYALQWVQGDHTSKRKISDRVAADMAMFKSFLKSSKQFLTSVPFLDRLGTHKNLLEILADASGNKNLGFGCYFPHTGEWFGASWTETNWFTPPPHGLGLEAYKMIFQLELLAITMAFKVFGKKLSGRVVILRSDNISVVNAINNMTSDLECAMQLLREITLTCMSLQILVKAVHIRGIHNSESDAISRRTLDKIPAFLKENPSFQKREIELTSNWWRTSWKPSTQRKYSGKTQLMKQGPRQSNFLLTFAKARKSRWN